MTDKDFADLGVFDASVDGMDVDAVRIEPMPGVERINAPDHDAVLLVRDDGHGVKWALLNWVSSNTDGSDARYEVEVCGYGIGGYLREARHTYFGDDGGYIHDVNPRQLAWAFGVLERWFDFS